MVSAALRLAPLLLPLSALAQSASLSGVVLDASGAPLPYATIQLHNPLTAFEKSVTADPSGAFRLTNLPVQTYTLTATKFGFQTHSRTVTVRPSGMQPLTLRLDLAGRQESLEVTASAGSVLEDPQQTGSYAQMNQSDIERLPLQAGTRGLEAVLVTFPGFAQNANGAIHPRGAHNQMTFVIDGMPVSDQLTGAFANAVDSNIVQTVELFTGNIPAEYGNKVAAVANVTTKTGLGSGRPVKGSIMTSAAGFSTLATVAQASGERGRWGYSGSFNAMKTQRYLDQVSLDNLHNGGNSQRGFLRLDYAASPRDMLRFTGMSGRSSFELANLRSQQAAGMDQRQALTDWSGSTGWVHTASPATVWEATTSYRSADAHLYDSPADIPVRASQDRSLATFNAGIRLNQTHGIHQLRAGADYQRFPVRELFEFAITDHTFNHPDADAFNPALLPHDLTRSGRPFRFSADQHGSLTSGFFQDTIRWGRWQIAAGLRWDRYAFLLREQSLQPRVGVSFHIRETGTVLRLSYNRTFQPPPNENLLLSSSPQAAALVSPEVRDRVGSGFALIRPELQHFYEAGLQQSLGRRLLLNAAVYHKDGTNQQDNNNFLNTPIIFPMALSSIRVNAAEARLIVPEVRGISGTLSLTHYRAISNPPFTGGLFIGNAALDALSQGPFVIDHDQKLSLHTVVSYTRRRWFLTTSIRHDSGLVVNPSNPAAVAADPDYRDLLPYVDLASRPPRTRPRTITDASAGYRRPGERGWEAVLQVANFANSTALYNFQSLFVGTRVVQPRTVALRLRWFF